MVIYFELLQCVCNSTARNANRSCKGCCCHGIKNVMRNGRRYIAQFKERFCICGHVYMKPAHGEPHDHGSSWAIYGLAEGDTEMTDWKVVRKGDGTNPILVEPEKVYTLRPGDAHFYDVHVIHSPKRDTVTKLVRIEGGNLDHIKRSNIKAAAKVAAE